MQTRHPVPGSPFAKERALMLERDLFTCSRGIARLFRSTAHDSGKRQDADRYVQSAIEAGVDRLLISNPYRTPFSREVYQYCRAHDFPFLIVERGGMPGSVFLDTSGFLSDSEHYAARYWDVELDANQRAEVGARMAAMANSKTFLERQPARPSPPPAKGEQPIVFIPLQMPTDTATRFFAHGDRDYAAFLDFAAEAASRFRGRFRFLFKAHPRAPSLEVRGAINASNLNINDAIKASDAILTFNSGTGLMSYLHDKPVATYGRAYYGQTGLSADVRTMDSLDEFLSAPSLSYSSEKRLRFFHHLFEQLYSDASFIGLPSRLGGSRPIAMRMDTARVFSPANPWSASLVQGWEPVRNWLELTLASKRWLANRLQ